MKIIHNGEGKLELTNKVIKGSKIIDTRKKSVILSDSKLSKLVSFGTTAILMRHLILNKFIGTIRTITIDIDGEFHTVNDRFNAPQLVTSTDQEEPTVQHVERRTISSTGKASKSTSVFKSPTGHLLQDLHEHSTYVIRRHSADPNFDDDVNLMLVDFVSSQKCIDNDERSHVKKVLRQFTECLIQSKPRELMDFTLEFLQKVERDAIVLKRSQKAAERRHQQNSSGKFSF